MKTVAIVSLAAITLSAAELTGPAQGNGPFTVHEWGTFTSVAGETGSPVAWAPLYGAPDLPCFVEHIGTVSKWQITGLVRMETPVLYFYSNQPLTLSVRVDFPQGTITEWYPRASRVTPNSAEPGGPVYRKGSIAWDAVHVLPGANLEFPSSHGASRYYAARQTDAAPLRIGQQQEKLLFYRGVASFAPPLRPSYASDGTLEIRNAGARPIPLAILFENHGGKIGYAVARNIDELVRLHPPALTSDLGRLRTELSADLVGLGLYPKEAAAMLETWRDSWFEEGTRVLYLMPRESVDSLLPLSVTPAPAETVRVFVGRVEILSPATRQTLEEAADRGDSLTLEKFGRFLGPFAGRLHLPAAKIQSALAQLARNSANSCIQ